MSNVNKNFEELKKVIAENDYKELKVSYWYLVSKNGRTDAPVVITKGAIHIDQKGQLEVTVPARYTGNKSIKPYIISNDNKIEKIDENAYDIYSRKDAKCADLTIKVINKKVHRC